MRANFGRLELENGVLNMFENLEYYKKLSEKLEKEIELYESSYQDFEKVFDFSVKPDKLTLDQKKVLNGFINFYQGEGIYHKGLTKLRYQKIRETIIARINFLKEQKTIVDKTVRLYEELDNLNKEDGLDASVVEGLKTKASDKYDPKTKKYNNYLNKLMEEYRSNRIESVNKELESTKKERSNIKKENGLIKVVSSVFGPFGNNVYNTWAKVHNFNTRNIRKYKPLNLLVKGSMVLLYASIVANLSLAGALSPFFVVVGYGSALAFAGITIKHSLPFVKYPEEVSLKNGVGSLKENWYKFLKSRGLGSSNIEDKIYKDVNFAKYDSSEDTVTEDMENTEEVKEEVTEEKVNVDAKEDESTLREEKVESTEETVKTEEEKIEEPKKEEPVRHRRRRASIKNTNDIMEINSLSDVAVAIRKFQDKGIKSIEDWYTIKNVRLFLGRNYSKTGDRNYLELRNMLDEIAKKMPKELRDKIAIANTFEKMEHIKVTSREELKKEESQSKSK